MKKGIARFTAFCLAAGFTFGEGGAVAMAAGADSALVGVSSTTKENVQVVEANGEIAEETENSTEMAESTESAEYTETSSQAAGTVGFAQVPDELNIRRTADTEGEVVGTIANNGALEILDLDENGWYYVRSGNVTGYVASQFVATGSEASEIAASAAVTTVTGGEQTVNIRAEQSTEGEIIGVIANNESVEVVANEGAWVKVVTSDGTYGYVNADMVVAQTSYAEAKSLADHAAEAAAAVEAAPAEAAPAETEAQVEETAAVEENVSYEETSYEEPVYEEASYEETSYDDGASYTEDTTSYDDGSSYTEDYSYDDGSSYTEDYSYDDGSSYTEDYSYDDGSSYTETSYDDGSSYTETSYDYTDLYSAQLSVQDAYAAYVEAQNAADAAAADGTDADLINSTAAAAQAAYAAYVEAQNLADAASWDQGYSETTTDDSYAEDTYTEDTYTEDYSDDSYSEETYYEEEYVEETEAPVSSVGESIAGYATQFVGNPYVWGGSSLTNGADCSGFTMSVFANFGISLPHSAAAQSGYGTEVSYDNLQPGDLLFYGDGGIGHVSIYIGGGQVVHASSSTTGIIISDVGYRSPVAIRRLV